MSPYSFQDYEYRTIMPPVSVGYGHAVWPYDDAGHPIIPALPANTSFSCTLELEDVNGEFAAWIKSCVGDNKRKRLLAALC